MLTTYRRVFAHPGALAFSATGLLARLPVAMMTLGIVLLVSALTGSYSLAGQISAAFVIGNGAAAIPHGRLVDRFGQHRLLYADSALFGLATGLMVVSIREDWALPLPHLLAVLAGVGMPMIGTMVRSRWAHLLDDEGEKQTAFAVESVVDEAIFVTGPVIVTFLSTLYAPESGLLVALVIGTGGTLALAAQRRTEPPAHPRDPAVARAPMPWRLLVPLTLAALALGSLFGAQGVATVAYADDAGRKAFSGVMLALFSLGSGIAGVVAGAMTWRRGPLQRARTGLVLLALGVLVLPLLDGLAVISAMLFVTGLTLAPTLIALLSIIERSVPRSRLNEAMGVVQTGVGAGLAPGAGIAGVVADLGGGSAAYWVGAGSGVLAACLLLAVPEVARSEPVPPSPALPG